MQLSHALSTTFGGDMYAGYTHPLTIKTWSICSQNSGPFLQSETTVQFDAPCVLIQKKTPMTQWNHSLVSMLNITLLGWNGTWCWGFIIWSSNEPFSCKKGCKGNMDQTSTPGEGETLTFSPALISLQRHLSWLALALLGEIKTQKYKCMSLFPCIGLR